MSSTDSQHDLPDNAVAVFAEGSLSGSIMKWTLTKEVVVATAAHGLFPRGAAHLPDSASKAKLFHLSLDENEEHTIVPLKWTELRLYSAYNRSDGQRGHDVAMFILDRTSKPLSEHDFDSLPFPDLVSYTAKSLIGRTLAGRGFFWNR